MRGAHTVNRITNTELEPQQLHGLNWEIDYVNFAYPCLTLSHSLSALIFWPFLLLKHAQSISIQEKKCECTHGNHQFKHEYAEKNRRGKRVSKQTKKRSLLEGIGAEYWMVLMSLELLLMMIRRQVNAATAASVTQHTKSTISERSKFYSNNIVRANENRRR